MLVKSTKFNTYQQEIIMENEKEMQPREYVNYLAGTKVVVNLTNEERESFISRIEKHHPTNLNISKHRMSNNINTG